jgi:hypothetical protein
MMHDKKSKMMAGGGRTKMMSSGGKMPMGADGRPTFVGDGKGKPAWLLVAWQRWLLVVE